LGDWRIYLLPLTSLPDLSARKKAGPVVKAGPSHNLAAATTKQPPATNSEFNPAERPIWSEQPAPVRPFLAPAYFHARFTLATAGDTFLDTRSLGKGVAFINGHNLGRFWSVGPQQTLYVPGPWLHKGTNEIVVFDLLPQAHESVEGLDHPILDGPVSDKTTSNQE
jgi:beta-galactosidase